MIGKESEKNQVREAISGAFDAAADHRQPATVTPLHRSPSGLSADHPLASLVRRRIVIIDGAMGTMIQRYKLDEQGFRGERFRDWHKDVQGASDLLCLTQPAIIEEIHTGYLDAGADIIETNTFNAQVISLADYDLQDLRL